MTAGRRSIDRNQLALAVMAQIRDRRTIGRMT